MAASGLIAIFVLHAINPDATIVRTNAALSSTSEREFDSDYAYRLSDDALPDALRATTPAPCTAQALLARDARRPTKWRTWNWSRWQAHAAIEARREELLRLSASCPPKPTSRTPPRPR
jgi:hypothetical protein